MTIRTVLTLIVSLFCFPTNANDAEVWKLEAHTNQGSFRLLGVEKALMQDSTRAASLLKVIPEAVFQESGFFKLHNHNCIANAYYYKTLGQIENGAFDEAQKTFLCFMNHCRLADEQQGKLLSSSDSLLLEELRFLESIIQAGSPNDSIIFALKQQMARFKQNIRPLFLPHKTLSTEYQLLHHKLYWPLLLVASFSVLFVILYQKKEKAAHNHLKEEERLRERITHLESQSNSNSSEIDKLNEQLTQLQEANMLRIGKGKHYFDLIKAGGTMKNISIDDEQCFIDYYAYTFPQEYHKLTAAYSSLTLRHTTFLILSEMGFPDKDICRILFVKDSTIRNYRLRISRKKN